MLDGFSRQSSGSSIGHFALPVGALIGSELDGSEVTEFGVDACVVVGNPSVEGGSAVEALGVALDKGKVVPSSK